MSDDSQTAAALELIELAHAYCKLFHDERGHGYAITEHKNTSRIMKLRARDFRLWLARKYYESTGLAAKSEARSTALSVLEAQAIFDGPQLALTNRFAMRDGDIYIDMADSLWRVIKVTADGWKIMDKPPVLFRRYSHQQSLPEPTCGGKLSAIHRHLAVKSADERYLLEAWLVACAFSNVPRPALTFHGPQGASKTTAARVVRSFSDPSLTDSVDLGKSPSELAQVLDHHGVPCFDNLTSIPTWAADMLCRAVTGGAFSKRELYSDESDVIFAFKRPIIITGINIPTLAPDLLDRMLLIELERIQPDKRCDETTFWERFNADRPKLFGALLDAIAGALKHLPDIKLDAMPRMADFARIACAYAEFAGIGSRAMLDIILNHTSRQIQEVLEADPVAVAVVRFIQKRQTWTGTAGQLLDLLNESVPTPRPEGWPRQANYLTRKMNVLHATLNDAGISVRKHKGGPNRDRLLTLEIAPDLSSSSSASARPSAIGKGEVDDTSTMSSAISPGLDTSAGECSDDADDTDGTFTPISGSTDSQNAVVLTA